MGLLDRFRKKKEDAAPAKAKPSKDAPSEPIVAFDGYGRRVEIRSSTNSLGVSAAAREPFSLSRSAAR
jgi:hypothetical protein